MKLFTICTLFFLFLSNAYSASFGKTLSFGEISEDESSCMQILITTSTTKNAFNNINFTLDKLLRSHSNLIEEYWLGFLFGAGEAKYVKNSQKSQELRQTLLDSINQSIRNSAPLLCLVERFKINDGEQWAILSNGQYITFSPDLASAREILENLVAKNFEPLEIYDEITKVFQRLCDSVRELKDHDSCRFLQNIQNNISKYFPKDSQREGFLQYSRKGRPLPVFAVYDDTGVAIMASRQTFKDSIQVRLLAPDNGTGLGGMISGAKNALGVGSYTATINVFETTEKPTILTFVKWQNFLDTFGNAIGSPPSNVSLEVIISGDQTLVERQ